ncbi:hypothetical protein QBC46DRAFT_460157 [Diplogelasinospora grovesii]|uniref:Heterokaryon incompatibility domain-containing protein n=1 Tax=Diplogelasinospora grovesii TaxID=303347 RepID=A0AAN6N3Q2_9PEZI|nr:hypothetical protein QBC46DRAFT_460157 [Diplogelasinospora grovesii]
MIRTPLQVEFDEFVDITEDEDAVSWNCKVHEPVLLLSNYFDNGLINRGRVALNKFKGESVFSVDRSKLHLVSRDDLSDHCGMGRIVEDAEWIDLGVIKGFLENCRTRHGGLCDRFPFGDDAVAIPRPTYLIDVEADYKSFVTLSYVPDTAARIPRTFRDAMHLAPLLGIRYLWIDLLCVIQDDAAHRQSENAKAALISAGAAFAIAECDGTDASHGIRGIRGIPGAKPRSFAQKRARFGEHETFVRLSGVLREDAVASYRAWLAGTTYPFQASAFAETALARRVLRFEMGTVQWKCQSYPPWAGDAKHDEHMWEDCAHYCDRARWGCQMDLPKEPEWDSDDDDDDDDDDAGPSNAQEPHWSTALSKPWPGVTEYYAMLRELTQMRTPTPPGDMLDEFTGVDVIPVVEWSVGDRADTPVQDRLALQSRRWYEAREAFREEASTPLPPGWTCVQRSINPLARFGAPRGYDKTNTVYRKSFWYPIPMRDSHVYDDDDDSKGTSPQDQIINKPFYYLFGTVERSRQHFYIHRADWPPNAQGDPFVKYVTRQGHQSQPGTHVLRDENGHVAGVLDVHDPDHGNLFHGDAAPERTPLDLIAISRGQTRQVNPSYPECDARPEWKDFYNTKWYEFYNVMLVAWSDDDASGVKVASRRGLGRVSREVWEAARKVTVDIVLG